MYDSLSTINPLKDDKGAIGLASKFGIAQVYDFNDFLLSTSRNSNHVLQICIFLECIEKYMQLHLRKIVTLNHMCLGHSYHCRLCILSI